MSDRYVTPFDVQLWEVLISRVNPTKKGLKCPMIGVGEGSGGESEYEIDDSVSTVEHSRVGLGTSKMNDIFLQQYLSYAISSNTTQT